MSAPRWTVEEVRAKRAADGKRREQLQALIARPLGGPVRQTIWSTKGGKIIRKGSIGEGDTLLSGAAIARFRSRMASGLANASSDFPYYGFAPNSEKDSA